MSTESASSAAWECACDIELAFVDTPYQTLMEIVADLDLKGVTIEDHTTRGWGSVVAREDEWVGDRRNIWMLIREFVGPLRMAIQLVSQRHQSSVIMRIAVYHSTYTYTLFLDHETSKLLGEVGVDVEITLYPAHTE